MRIYKGSENTLKLYIHADCQSIQADNWRVVFYTTIPEDYIEITNVYKDGDFLYATTNKTSFVNMKDGVITYVAYGYNEGNEVYSETRQSNYYLKTPNSHIDGVFQPVKEVEFTENGIYTVNPDGKYLGMEQVNVNVNLDVNSKIEQAFRDGVDIGKQEGVEEYKTTIVPIEIKSNGTIDATDGYYMPGGEPMGYLFRYQGGGQDFEYPTNNSMKIELVYAHYNDAGEYFDNTKRGIFGNDRFFVAEDAENPYLIYAKVGNWESQRYEIGDDFYHISLSNKEFRVNGVLIDTVPEGEYNGEGNHIFVNGIAYAEGNGHDGNYFYPNVAFYHNFKMWIDDNLVIDAKPVYIEENNHWVGWIDSISNTIRNIYWAIKSSYVSVMYTDAPELIKVNGFNKVIVEVPDTNGDYQTGFDEGYSQGNQAGYDTGYMEGETAGYDNGYTAGIDYASENAGEIVAANAIDLVATEIGPYYTKYSDNIVNPNPVTGIYPDGETFHNLAEVKNIVYNTGIIPNETTKLEFWFVPDLIRDDQDGDWYSVVIDAEKTDTNNFRIRHYHPGVSFQYQFQIANSKIMATLKDGVNHIEMSYADGLIVNGEKVGDFTLNINNEFDQPFYINGTPHHTPPSRTDDGEFGIIKITTNGTTNVIIPTEDGFKNITTNQLLETLYNEGTYKYKNNDPIVLDNLIKQVNVSPKIDVAETGIKFGNSTFREIPDFYDFNNVVDMSNMFNNCAIQTIPKINTSNVNNMAGMFNNCVNLQTIPLIDTSNVTKMDNMFQGCKSLQAIPLIDTSNVINMSYMFSNCGNLKTIPQLDTSNVNFMESMFYGSSSLVSIPPLNANNLTFGGYDGLFYFTTMNSLTDFGGLIGLKSKSNNDYTFVRCPNLTYQSCINILNGLYDFIGNGETPTSDQGRLKVHQNFLTTVGDEISIATNKGWQVSA